MFKVNQYFDGKVASIGFQTATLPATVGVMAVGEYEFGTNQKEVMTVISGAIIAKLPGCDDWQTYSASESFTIDANQTFQVKIDIETAYMCTYE